MKKVKWPKYRWMVWRDNGGRGGWLDPDFYDSEKQAKQFSCEGDVIFRVEIRPAPRKKVKK